MVFYVAFTAIHLYHAVGGGTVVVFIVVLVADACIAELGRSHRRTPCIAHILIGHVDIAFQFYGLIHLDTVFVGLGGKLRNIVVSTGLAFPWIGKTKCLRFKRC